MEEPDQTDNALEYTDNISVTWKEVDFQPDDMHLALVNESNESFLRAVSALGETVKESPDESSGLSQEVARLDLKLNLLLDLVSQLVYKQLDIPETTNATISSTDIQWCSADVPMPGKKVFMQAYIQHGTPKPLCFYGNVVSTQNDYDDGVAKVRFDGLSSAAQSWLDKLIFRHHRRTVAFSKQKLTEK